MTLLDLIERGYFPKELPPPFNTKSFSLQIATVLITWNDIFENNTDISSLTFPLTQNAGESNSNFKNRKKAHRDNFILKYNSSKGAIFSISKGKLSRRFLQIPNPKHFSLLSEKIIMNWQAFQDIFSLSEYSKSYPLVETSPKKRSVSTFSKGVADFRDSLLDTSFGKSIEVKVDISKFYPTIYTHSIAWALLGKENAKNYFKQKANLDSLIAAGDLNAALYKSAEAIDIALRSCQERQSIGIPIGPDTSHILAEAVACRIDSILKTKFDSIELRACRYYDDYYLYVSTKDEADIVLKGLQLILNDFQLEINESKVRIKEFPFSFEDEFVTKLFLFDFKKTNISNSLKHYFSLIWGFAEKNHTKADWVFKYALRIFEFGTVKIPKKSWKIFENLLLKTALIEPSILDIVTRVLLSYQTFIDADSKTKIKVLISTIIKEHSQINHNFEVSWALWISKTFNIPIDENTANKVIEIKDNISILILLDLFVNTSLVQGTPSFNSIEAELTDDILFSESWLLAYESVKKGWLTPANPSLLDDNLFFQILKNLNVEFYDSTKQLTTYYSVESEQVSEPISNEINTNQTDVIPNFIEVPDNNLSEFIESLPSGF